MLYDGRAGLETAAGVCGSWRASGIMASVNLLYRTVGLVGLHVNRRRWIDSACNTELSPAASSPGLPLTVHCILVPSAFAWLYRRSFWSLERWTTRGRWWWWGWGLKLDNIFFTRADGGAKNSRFHRGEGSVLGGAQELVCRPPCTRPPGPRWWTAFKLWCRGRTCSLITLHSPSVGYSGCVYVSAPEEQQQQRLVSDTAKSRGPDEALWFLRQHFPPLTFTLVPPPTSLTYSATWQTVVWPRLDIRCTQRQTLQHRRCQSNDTGEESSDVFGQEDDDFSRADCAEGRIRARLPGHVALPPGLWMGPVASHPLVPVVLWDCGCGLISLWQRQIEEAAFDNVRKEIRFPPLRVSREADKMAVLSPRVAVSLHRHTSLLEKIRRVVDFSCNSASPRKIILFPNAPANSECIAAKPFWVSQSSYLYWGWTINRLKSKWQSERV